MKRFIITLCVLAAASSVYSFASSAKEKVQDVALTRAAQIEAATN